MAATEVKGPAGAEGPLYVTGLPIGCDEERAKQIFGQYGLVKSVKVLPPHPQKPDVAAIVVMESVDQAKVLVENVSGTVPGGLTEPVDIKHKNSRSSEKGWGKGGQYGYMPPWMMMQYWQYGKGKGKSKGWGWSNSGLSSFPAERKVWIGNLPETVTYQELQAHFGGPAKAKFATVMKGKAAGTAGVAFATPQEATEAIEKLNGSILGGAPIVVDVWTKKEKEPKAAMV